MKYSEKVLNRLKEISEQNEVDIIEACGIFCEENDLDEAEFINTLDKTAVEQIKYEAIKANRVRKCVATLGPEVM